MKSEAGFRNDPNSLNLCVRRTRGKGRGIFAKRKIFKGEIIERAPVIVLPAEQWNHIQRTVLFNYAYEWGGEGEYAAIALGYVSLYNHSYKPNALLEMCLDDDLMEIVALREIRAGAEILVNYNGEPANAKPLWFKTV